MSSPFITDPSSPNNRFTQSREVLASLRGRRAGRHMMGSEGEAEQSEKRPAEAERRSLRTRLVHRPREGCSSADSGTRGPSSCRRGGISLLAPTEFRTVYPHAVQDNGEASGQGDDRLLGSAATSNLHAPGLEPGPFLGACEKHLRRLVECRPHHCVAALRDPPVIVHLARLKAAWR